MARKIIFKENGLLNSSNTPTGYRYIGYDGVIVSEKFGATISAIGGGGGLNFATADLTFTANRTHDLAGWVTILDNAELKIRSVVGATGTDTPFSITKSDNSPIFHVNGSGNIGVNTTGQSDRRVHIYSNSDPGINYLMSLFQNTGNAVPLVISNGGNNSSMWITGTEGILAQVTNTGLRVQSSGYGVFAEVGTAGWCFRADGRYGHLINMDGNSAGSGILVSSASMSRTVFRISGDDKIYTHAAEFKIRSLGDTSGDVPFRVRNSGDLDDFVQIKGDGSIIFKSHITGTNATPRFEVDNGYMQIYSTTLQPGIVFSSGQSATNFGPSLGFNDSSGALAYMNFLKNSSVRIINSQTNLGIIQTIRGTAVSTLGFLNDEVNFYYDDGTNDFKIRFKKADGTVITKTIAASSVSTVIES